MPKNRILPAIGVAVLVPLAAWAQDPAAPAPAGSVQAAQAQAKAKAKPAPAEPPTEAEKALDEAAAKVAALRSVSADLTETVDMLDERFTVQGRYLKAPGNRVYLQLKVDGLPDSSAQMLQVCDGQTLWDYQQVLDSQIYGKLVVAQVLEKLKSPELDETMRQMVTAQFGFGGPGELLKGLRDAVKFDQKSADTLDGKDVWVLTGEWKNREGLVGANQQQLPQLGWLPAYVPSLVTVWVGKEDGWPYKVRLLGRRPPAAIDTRKKGPDGKPIGRLASIPKITPTSIDLVYSRVTFNTDLKAEEFAFTPPQNARVEDRTQAIVGMLDQAIQYHAAAKKAEAAKGDDALLKQPIDLPRPSTPDPLPVPAEPK